MNLRMQPHKERILLPQMPGEKAGIQPGEQVFVLIRIIPERRRIEHQLFPPALRVALVKTGAQCNKIMRAKEKIRTRRAERKHLFPVHMECTCIMRCNAFGRADDEAKLCIPSRLPCANFGRLVDILPKPFERALRMPQLCNHRLLAQAKAGKRHEVIVEKNIFRTGQSICFYGKEADGAKDGAHQRGKTRIRLQAKVFSRDFDKEKSLVLFPKCAFHFTEAIVEPRVMHGDERNPFLLHRKNPA